MTEALVLLVFLPFAGAVLCLAARFLPRVPLAPAAACGAGAGVLLLLALLAPAVRARGVLVYAVGGWLEPLGISLYLDMLAWSSSLMGAVVGLCALLFAVGERRHRYDFFFFFLMLMAGMEGVILTGDLFNMFVFLEILSISSYVLIAEGGKGRSLLAGLRYLLASSLAIAFFLLGVFLVYRASGTLSLRLLASAAALRSGPAAVAAAALTVGVGLKAAFVPLHTWLPAAHAAAPHPVSAVLSGVMIKVSLLAVWRILSALGPAGPGVFLWLGMLTALLGVGMAIAQTDSKRLLAYHSVSQMGLIVAAYGAGTAAGLAAAYAHVLSHSLFKSLLFLSVGAVIHLGGRRDLKEQGPGNPAPWLLGFFLVGALSIAGLPPWGGYVSKSLLASVLKEHPVMAVCFRVVAAGTAASMIKLSGLFLRPRREPAAAPAGRAGPSPLVTVSLSILALLCLAGGLFPRLALDWLVAPAMGAAGKGQGGAVYAAAPLIEALAAAAAGLILYLGVRSRVGGRLTAALARRRVSLDDALLLVVVAFLVFALFGRLPRPG